MSEVSKYRGLDPAAGGMTMKIKAAGRRVDELVALTAAMNDEQLKLILAMGIRLTKARDTEIEERLVELFFKRLSAALRVALVPGVDQDLDDYTEFDRIQTDTAARVFLDMEDLGLYPSDRLSHALDEHFEDMSGTSAHNMFVRAAEIDAELIAAKSARRVEQAQQVNSAWVGAMSDHPQVRVLRIAGLSDDQICAAMGISSIGGQS